MTDHMHAKFMGHCYRCDLNRDETDAGDGCTDCAHPWDEHFAGGRCLTCKDCDSYA